MAIVHRTTLTPTKLDLISDWLPSRPWYQAKGKAPSPATLTRLGGFRLDDPAGEVGIELMVVGDTAGETPQYYLAPLTYRGAPLPDAPDEALLGTAEHGVLGTRWIYDAAHDPVFVTQLCALFLGETEAQAQRESNTPDPSVAHHYTGAAHTAAEFRTTRTESGPRTTDIVVEPGPLTFRINRVLTNEGIGEGPVGEPWSALGHLTADWTLIDETPARGKYVVILDGTPDQS
ncbi:1,4-alpha-glucan branching protein [Streptomyces triticagri]|uniref:1,4-alpha-glucan branching protein n=1 Tax=Streptomyces triticagri TaxID=2293568 RepID=A0A372MCR5_9ACTN|nr:1,4-alpha-glucan branching protein [Streptomyces triticagri]RFU88370.1 1,4-alpha-glucan branching protein [Streptomyces triticagri]